MKVLVTGGAGFIGKATCQVLEEQGHRVIVYDRRRYPSDGRAMILGDIRDQTAVTEAVAEVEGVIHLAGVLGTQETIANPYPAAETNILGGLNVLSACAQYDVPLVNIAVGNYFEANTYSITKSSVERFAIMNALYRDARQVSVRAFNAYGPGQSVAAPHGPSKVRKILPSFITRALHGEDIEVYGSGSQIMDMIMVQDVAAVLVAALGWVATGQGKEHPDMILEAGSGDHTTVMTIARLVQAEVAKQSRIYSAIKNLPLRPGETKDVTVQAQMEKTKYLLGLDTSGFTPLPDGIARTVKFYHATMPH